MKLSELLHIPYHRLDQELLDQYRMLSTRYLIEGGYIHPLGEGLYSFLPMGMRVINHIARFISAELKTVGGEEILLPLVNPESLWATSGRKAMIADELTVFRNNRGKSMVLAPMHEEAAVELVKRTISSVDQLPRFMYQYQGKYRDETLDESGLMKAREFLMNDAYSFHRSFADLNNFMPKIFAVYKRIFTRLGLNVMTTEGAANFTGGTSSYDFLLKNDLGEDILVTCTQCGYSANQDVAVGVASRNGGRLLEMEEKAYDDCFALECLRRRGGLPETRTVESRIYSTVRGYVMVVYRSDKTVSPDKLARVINAPVIARLKDEDLKDLGFPAYTMQPKRRGQKPFTSAAAFLNPISYARPELNGQEFIVAVDTSVTDSNNLIFPRGIPGRFYINANFGRDFDADYAGDFTLVDDACTCYHCKGPLTIERTIKLASVYRIGEFYTRRFNYTLPDELGKPFYPSMGTYGIGLGRLVASLVEAHRYKDRFLWPMSVAPFKAAMVIVGRGSTIQEIGQKVHDRLGKSVLLDDRKIPLTHKFKELDRTGIPVRIIVSGQTLDDGKVMISHPRYCPPVRIQLNHIEAKIRDIEELEQSRFSEGKLMPED